MKFLLPFVFCLIGLAVAAIPANDDLQCSYALPDVTKVWIQMTDPCIKAIKKVVVKKLNNSIQYLALAAYYLQDAVNRPGFGNVFIKGARKDREYAIDLIDYLNLRGQNTQGQLVQLPLNFVPPKTSWNTVVEAVDFVIAFEADMTNAFISTITICERQPFDDYHVTNTFSRTFLQRQYDDMKWFADVDSSLRKMLKDHNKLGEFLSDTILHFEMKDEGQMNY